MFGYEDSLKERIEELVKENNRLRSALAYYADTSNWLPHPDYYAEYRLISETDLRETLMEEGDAFVGGKLATIALEEDET